MDFAQTRSSVLLEFRASRAAVVALLLAGIHSTRGAVSIVSTTDLGGGRSQSANARYTIDASIGGIGGYGTASPTLETVRHGYIGQFSEVKTFSITNSSVDMNEGESRQLTNFTTLDDDTVLKLRGSDIQWIVLNGPISISADGLAQAAPVYENRTAQVSGRYANAQATLNLSVTDGNPDNFGIYASDGLPDRWQVDYFGTSNISAAATFDADGDDQNNRFEYIAGTNPTNSASLFRFRIETVAGQPWHKKLIFSPRLTNRTYAVEFNTNSPAGVFGPLTGGVQSDSGSERTVIDEAATQSRKFYRVKLSLSP